MAEPEVLDEAELLHDPHPLTDERAYDDEDAGAEEDIHAEGLILRLCARYGRGDIEPCSEPGGRDPEDGELYVPAARDGLREEVLDR